MGIVIALLFVSCSSLISQSPLSLPVPTAAVGAASPFAAVSTQLTPEAAEGQDTAGGLLTFRGESMYPGMRQYEVEYDAARWQLIGAAPGNFKPYEMRLQDRRTPACMLDLFNGLLEGEYSREVEFGGRKWRIGAPVEIMDPVTGYQVVEVSYITQAQDPIGGAIAYFFLIFVPAQAEPDSRSECQQAAEAVLTTFRIVNSVREE